MESTNSDILYGVDSDNKLWYTNDLADLDEKWRPVPRLEELLNNEGEQVKEITCNHFSCWVLTSTGNVYSMNTPWDPSNAQWTRDYGKDFITV